MKMPKPKNKSAWKIVLAGILVALLLILAANSFTPFLAVQSTNPIHIYAAEGQETCEVYLAIFFMYHYGTPEWQVLKDKVVAYEQTLIYAYQQPRLWSQGAYYMSAVVDLDESVAISVDVYNAQQIALGSYSGQSTMSVYFMGAMDSNPAAIVTTGLVFTCPVASPKMFFNYHISASGDINMEDDGQASGWIYKTVSIPAPVESLPVATEEIIEKLHVDTEAPVIAPKQSTEIPRDETWQIDEPVVIEQDTQWIEANTNQAGFDATNFYTAVVVIIICVAIVYAVRKRKRK